MSVFKKILAGALAVGLMTAFVGCNKDQDHENLVGDTMGDDVNVNYEDMPYGSTVTKIQPSGNEKCRITCEYDHRFLEEEEIFKLCDYFYALSHVDTELMEATVHPDYLAYICTQGGYADTAGYFQAMYDNLKDNYIGEDFEFDYLIITDCLDETADDTETSFSGLDNIITTIFGEDILDKITSRKLVTVSTMYTLKESGVSHTTSDKTGEDSKLYLYEIDGQTYVF